MEIVELHNIGRDPQHLWQGVGDLRNNRLEPGHDLQQSLEASSVDAREFERVQGLRLSVIVCACERVVHIAREGLRCGAFGAARESDAVGVPPALQEFEEGGMARSFERASPHTTAVRGGIERQRVAPHKELVTRQMGPNGPEGDGREVSPPSGVLLRGEDLDERRPHLIYVALSHIRPRRGHDHARDSQKHEHSTISGVLLLRHKKPSRSDGPVLGVENLPRLVFGLEDKPSKQRLVHEGGILVFVALGQAVVDVDAAVLKVHYCPKPVIPPAWTGAK
eukprot:4856650-Prymnesium_polylepis.1